MNAHRRARLPLSVDLATAAVVGLAIAPMLFGGTVTFTDLTFGRTTDRVLDSVGSVFNAHLSTANWFNLPRLPFVAVAKVFADIFAGGDASVFLWAMTTVTLTLGAWGVMRLAHDVAAARPGRTLSPAILVLVGLVYALNPWSIQRIQHIYLLCGYALYPWVWWLALRSWGPQTWRRAGGFVVRPRADDLVYMMGLGAAVAVSFAGVHFGFLSGLTLVPVGLGCAVWALTDAVKQRTIGRWLAFFAVRAAVPAVSFGAFAAYWSWPLVSGILNQVRPSQFNVNAYENIILFSRYSDLTSVLSASSYWWPMVPLETFGEASGPAAILLWSLALIGVARLRELPLAVPVGGLVVLATGAHYPALAENYLGLVFELPYPLGDMLRDPNKIVGVLLLALCLMLARGLSRIDDGGWAGRLLGPVLGVAAWLVWVLPFWRVYMLGFYLPVDWPAQQIALSEHLRSLPTEARVLYLPLANEVIDPSLGFSSPDFNTVTVEGREIAKATADFAIVDSPRDTVFPYEGNPISVERMLVYLHEVLERGDVEAFGDLARALGVTHVVHRSSYASHRDRLLREQELLSRQPDLTETWSSGDIRVYTVEDAETTARVLQRVVYTTADQEHLTTLRRLLGWRASETGHVFAAQSSGTTMSVLGPGDWVDVSSRHALLLAQVPSDQLVAPADHMSEGRPSVGWAKGYLQGPDLEWQLELAGAGDAVIGADLSMPQVFTSSARRLIMPSWEEASALRVPLIDESAWQDVEGVPTAEVLDVEPLMLEVNGVRMRWSTTETEGQAGRQWSVVSQSFPLAGGRAHALQVEVEGAVEPGVVVRVVCMDEEGRTLGSQVLALVHDPGGRGTVHRSFITPTWATQARVELIGPGDAPSLGWSVKDLSLGQYVDGDAPNLLTVPMDVPSGSGALWVRALCSRGGGVLRVAIGATSTTLDTRCPASPRLKWFRAEGLQGPADRLSISNEGGFNSVNALTWMTPEDEAALEEGLAAGLEDKRLLAIRDLWEDGEWSGALRSGRADPRWTAGRTLRSVRGEATVSLWVPRDGVYDLVVNDEVPPGGEYGLEVVDPSGARVFETVVAHDGAEGVRQLERLSLERGTYTVSARFRADPEGTLSWDALSSPGTRWFVRTSPEQRRIRRMAGSSTETQAVLLTPEVPVMPGEQVLVGFRYHLHGGRDLHARFRFLDASGHNIATRVDRFPRRWSAHSDRVATVVEPPPGATALVTELAFSPGEATDRDSYLDVFDFELWTEERGIALDSVVLIQADRSAAADASRVEVVESEGGTRRLRVQGGEGRLLELLETPNRLWTASEDGAARPTLSVRGTSVGIRLEEDDAGVVFTVPYDAIHRRGVWVSNISALGLFGLWGVTLWRRRQSR